MKIRLHKVFLLWFSFFLPGFFNLGCSVWNNFTTYFNLYYNTSNLFDSAEETIKEQNTDIFNTDNIIVPGSAKQQLGKVVEKASAILQFHLESGYVHNALLMLGKAFYYQKTYQKALRKFQELIAAEPDENEILQARLWIGKTHLRLRNFDKGLTVLDEVIQEALKKDEQEILSGAYIEEISYNIYQENYSSAIALSEEFLVVSENDEINAEVAFQVGRLYVDLNDPENAIKSFMRVFDYSPNYETELTASIDLGMALRRDQQYDRALNVFEDLRSENKYFDSYDRIDLEIALTKFESGNIKQAVSELTLVDTTYPSSMNSGAAKFKLGEIYENVYRDFDSAYYYYNRAANSLSPPEYTLLVNDKVKLFNRYRKFSADLNDYYQQLNYIQNPEEFLQDSIAYYSDTLSSATEDSTLQQGKTEQPGQFQGRNRFSRDRARELNQVVESKTSDVNNVVKKGDPPVRPAISEDSVKSMIVKNSFHLGNLFFTEFNLLDSARRYYTTILNDFPNSEYQARTMYALGSYYQTIEKNEKADSLFNLIYNNYKNESIVNAAADKLKKPLIDLQYDPAKELYTEAENRLYEGAYKKSLEGFFEIYKSYPESELAPKALYSAGWILENKLQKYDSAAAVYDSLNTYYSASIYAKAVLPKFNLYNQELEKIRKAREDSLKLIQQKMQDSIAVDSVKADAVDSSKINPLENLSAQDSPRNELPSDSLLIKNNENQKSMNDSIPKNRREIIPKEERIINQIDSLNKSVIDTLR